jgi:TolB protein
MIRMHSPSTRWSRAALLLALAAITPAGAQRIATTGPISKLPAPVPLDTTGRFLAAAVRVGDDFFIAGQPTERALREMHDQGVTTVVNLRSPEEMQNQVKFDERAVVGQLGMKYVYLPMRGTPDFPYAPDAVTKLAAAVAGANGKVLLHCTVAWRASHLWAAYLISERGVDVETALANARAINLMDDHRMGPGGRQPVEDFLNRTLPTLGHPQVPTPKNAAPQPKRPPINGGLPDVSPDGKWIAFVREGDGVAPGLYVIGVDGSKERRLADAGAGAAHWLPDGSGLYFGVGKFTDDSSDIRVVKLSGGAPTLLERIPAKDAKMTPDMKGLYASSGKWPNLGLVHIPLGAHQVHHITETPGAYFNIAIGPDERLAFTHADSGMHMQVWTIKSGELQPITHIAAEEGSPQWPSWSPDGKSIAVQVGKYSQKEPASNTSHVWLVDANTGAARKLASHERAYLDETPAFFPDGKRIAFQSDRTGRMEVWVMNVDGTGARQVTR